MDSDPTEENTQSASNIVFEASTQTPTNEPCDSPMFTQKGYCLKTNGHSVQALTNMQRMRQHGQVRDKICLGSCLLL